MLKAFLFLLGFLGPLLALAADSAPSVDEIRASVAEAFTGVDVIRVKIENGPGNGDQVAAVRMIQRLRELGFGGRIQIVYSDPVAEKLPYLIPGFAKESLDLQRVESPRLGRLELVAESRAKDVIKAERVKLALSAANVARTSPNTPDILNAESFVQMQPRRWKLPTSERVVLIEGRAPVSTLQHWNLGSAVKNEAVSDWGAFLAKELAQAPPVVREKEAGLRALLAAADHAEFLPAYAIDIDNHPEWVLGEVVKGLRRASEIEPGAFPKPILLPVLTEYKTDAQRQAVTEAMRELGAGTVAVKSADLPARLAAARPGEILLVEVGQLPPVVFDAVASRATLPALLAGRNLTNTLVDHGAPLLNVLGRLDDIAAEVNAPGTPGEVRALITNAHEAFDTRHFRLPGHEERNLNAIAKFYLASRGPDAPVRRFFRALELDPADLRRDLVAMSLYELKRARAAPAPRAAAAIHPGVPWSPPAASCPQRFGQVRNP